MAVTRMTLTRLWVAATFASGGLAGAQTAPVVVRGVAYDSVRAAPLGNAFVAIVGRPGSTTTDARGRFQLTVPARFMNPGNRCGAVVVWTK